MVLQTFFNVSPCSEIHSAECDPVVQRGVFGLKIGQNGTNYREPAFQSVGINAGSHIAADDVASKKPACPAIDQIKPPALWSKLWSKPNEVSPQTKKSNDF